MKHFLNYVYYLPRHSGLIKSEKKCNLGDATLFASMALNQRFWILFQSGIFLKKTLR